MPENQDNIKLDSTQEEEKEELVETSEKIENENIHDEFPEDLEVEAEIVEIPLDEVCEICLKYSLGEMDQKEFSKWVKKIKIVHYLPLLDKAVCLSTLLLKNSFEEDSDPEWQIIALEQYKFWDILLKYTNIQTEGYEDYKTLNNYDAVYSSIGDYIAANCYNDYNRIIQMFESTVNVYNVQNLLRIFNNFDEEKMQKSSEELNQELESLSKHSGMIDKLAEILINKPNK
jgi:hypothetical protein